MIFLISSSQIPKRTLTRTESCGVHHLAITNCWIIWTVAFTCYGEEWGWCGMEEKKRISITHLRYLWLCYYAPEFLPKIELKYKLSRSPQILHYYLFPIVLNILYSLQTSFQNPHEYTEQINQKHIDLRTVVQRRLLEFTRGWVSRERCLETNTGLVNMGGAPEQQLCSRALL